jgi:hypothetical protein
MTEITAILHMTASQRYPIQWRSSSTSSATFIPWNSRR